eukprot:339219-Prymnesium_polylepis.1
MNVSAPIWGPDFLYAPSSMALDGEVKGPEPPGFIHARLVLLHEPNGTCRQPMKGLSVGPGGEVVLSCQEPKSKAVASSP